jgi:hypothetical protein
VPQDFPLITTYPEPEEVMQSLIGRRIANWGKDETMYHLSLDDGRVLIFMALGVATYPEHAIH